jgi:hypothetical protein
MQQWRDNEFPLTNTEDYLVYALVQIRQSLTEIATEKFNSAIDILKS